MKEGWKIKTLGELCEINIGRTPSRSDNSLWDKEKESHNVWVSIADMPDCPTDTIYETKEYISDKAARNINIIKKGTILLSFKLTLGKTAIAGIDLYTNEAIANLPIKDKEISREYLLYYFRFFDWNSYSSGEEKVKGKTLNKKKLDVLPIYYPSLSEQQAIVSRLDSAFAKIDAVKANAEKQLNDAKALFQKELSKAMTPKEGWEEKKVGEIFNTYAGGTPIKTHKEYYEGGDIPWIRSGEVCCKYITECEMFITEEGMNNSSAKYYPENTVLVAMYGATAAQVGILKFEATSNQAVCGILPHKDFVPEYVYYWFSNIQEELAAQAQGGAQPNISQIKIKNVVIPYAPLSEQQAIVTHLDTLSEKLKAVEERQKAIMAECDAMKQALLREVFETPPRPSQGEGES